MINDKCKEFIANLDESKREGFNGYSILTHAWHESGGFENVIGGWNCWGIKKPRVWGGKVIHVLTHEYIKDKNGDNNKIACYDDFIDFTSCLEAVRWYCDFIKRLYPNAYDNRDNPPEYFKGLVNGRNQYATDPAYVPALLKVYAYLNTLGLSLS